LRGFLAAAFLLLGPALSAQDFSDITVEKVEGGFRFTEGPVWSKEGFLLFSDVPNNRIRKWVPGQKTAVLRENSNGANGNTFDAQGRLYSCESKTRRVVRTDKDGRIEVLADKWEGKRLNAPNDIVVSRNGHVYFTDPAFGDQADSRELDFYGVYHIPPKGPMKLIAKPTGRPNGIALSSNGRILYVANSDERNVRAYDIDRNGDTSNERVVISGIDGVPDGIRADEKGNLYIAANGIAVYTAAGKLLNTIPLGEVPANCAFGDDDFKTLYITARSSVYRVRLDVKGAVQY
jgi:gluconolactonase